MLLNHPSVWVRYSAISFFSGIPKHFKIPDVSCLVVPLVNQVLDTPVPDLDEMRLLYHSEVLSQPRVSESPEYTLFDRNLGFINLKNNKILPHSYKEQFLEFDSSAFLSLTLSERSSQGTSQSEMPRRLDSPRSTNWRPLNKYVTRIKAHKTVIAMRLSPDEIHLLTAGKLTIKLWDMKGIGQNFTSIPLLEGTSHSEITDAQFVSSSVLCIATLVGLSLVKIDLPHDSFTFYANFQSKNAFKLIVEDKIYCACEGNKILVLSLELEKESELKVDHSYGMISSISNSDHWFAVGTEKGFLLILDKRFEIVVFSVRYSDSPLVSISNHQELIVCLFADFNMYEISLKTQTIKSQYRVNLNGIDSVATCLHSKHSNCFHLVGSSEGIIHYWDKALFQKSFNLRRKGDSSKYAIEDGVFIEYRQAEIISNVSQIECILHCAWPTLYIIAGDYQGYLHIWS